MNGTNTPSPAGQANAVRRPPPRRAAANPLVKRKPKPQVTGPQPAAHPLPPRSNGPNGSLPPVSFPQTYNANRPLAAPVPKIEDEEFVDIPIYTTKREMLEGYRHHVMRFLPSGSSKVRNVDLASEAQFSRPVKLHRRDPKATLQMHWKEGGGEAEDVKGNGIDEAEREKLDKQRAERRKEREDNLAQMAPVAKAAQQTKKNHFQKKTEQVFQVNADKAHKVKDFQLRYEEALPWHVEDFDGKNTWFGTYEGALSDCHVMLVQEDNGQGGSHFRMVPLEKWYKFAQKNQFKALSIEEAEARMSKRVKDPRWFMDTQKATEQAQKQATGGRPGGKGLFTRVGERGERAARGEGDDGPEVAADIDDIDYNYEEAFADDEENALFEGLEDESKEAEEKIKREQRDANIFELKEQKDYDKEEEEEKRKKKEEKKKAKRTRKALMKQEKNYVYEDDSESNPYTSESESEDSETERQREEESKKDEEAKALADKSKPSTSSQTTSDVGARPSTPGTPSTKTTPSLKKGILKRSGSPNLSEASGSETSRVKKAKKKHTASGLDNASVSRPNSPTNGSVVSGAGAGSDAEMSDASKKKKSLKITMPRLGGSRPATPSGSRTGSPAPGSAAVALPGSGNATTLPTDEFIRSQIPSDGLLLPELIKKFPLAATKHKGFIAAIKANARWDAATKKLFPKGVA